MSTDNSFNDGEDQLESTAENVQLDDTVFSLIGNVSAPYLIYSVKENVEIMIENYSSYLGFEASVLGEVLVLGNQLNLFENILSVNYGQDSAINYLYNHPSLWDLFAITLTDIQRLFLLTRFKNFHQTFEHDFSDQIVSFPDFCTPYWSEGHLFPVLFRQKLSEEVI
jgi:hypothetical protein